MKKKANIVKIECLSILLILASGCSTITVPLKVTHPAEIDMSQYKQIAIGHIDGNMGRTFSDRVKNSLVKSGRFKVVDRSQLQHILTEQNLSQSGLSDPKNRVKVGKLLTASAMITGHTEGGYEEGISSYKMTCGSKKEGYYTCTEYTREGIYRTSGSIDVIDIETGEIINSKMLNAHAKDSNSAIDRTPGYIDKGNLMSSVLIENVSSFLKSIKPWVEMVKVPFIKDSALPSLERGINQAKIGDIDKSIETFSKAVKFAEGNAKIDPETIAKAYFNLGLAYNFSWQFDNAITAFKKAFELDTDQKNIRWIKKSESMKKERKKLETQRSNLE